MKQKRISSWTIAGLIAAVLFLFINLGFAIDQKLGPFAYAQGLAPPLANPGLERPYSARGSPEVEVAEWWEPWWREGDGYHRPEFKPMEEEDRVYEGDTSQKTFTVYSKHFGGLYQVVDGFREDSWYKFSCMLQMKSNGGKSFGAVGVNPWGNAWPRHWTTQWGKAAYNTFDEWVEVEVVFQAWSPTAALFTMGEGEWAVSWQDWYWDSCSIESVDITAPPTPIPTVEPPTPSPCECDCATAEEVQWIVDHREPVTWPRP